MLSWTVARSAVVSLAGGQALLVTADLQKDSVVTLNAVEYVVPHGTLLFRLLLQADARDSGALGTFAAIADRFAFVRG